MSNLEDFVAVQWTCRTIVSSDVDLQIRSLGGQVDHPALLQRAAEAVASCARYERDLSQVEFSATFESSMGRQAIGLCVRFDLTPTPLVVLSLGHATEAASPLSADDCVGDGHRTMIIESQAVRHEHA